MKKRLLFLSAAVLLAAGAVPEAAAQTEEELLFTEIPTVVTASKREQKVTEAPAAVTVVTGDELRMSGATNIPDALRYVPGMDVIFISESDRNMSMRGYSGMVVNEVLVMVDGRSVYLDFYGMIIWDVIPVTLDDVERIEIIRGPGSSLYGANAYCGVINIITKSPDKVKPGFSFYKGDRNLYQGSVLFGGTSGKSGYKVTAGRNQFDNWREDPKNSQSTMGTALYQYQLSDDSKVSLSAGQGRDYGESATSLGRYDRFGQLSHVQANYELRDLKVRAFWNNLDARVTRRGIEDRFPTNTYDLEVQHLLGWMDRNSLLWGGSYRRNDLKKWIMIKEDRSQDLYALFMENEFKYSDQLKLVAGFRYDHHPLVKGQTSPRGAVVFSPDKDQTFRLSAATAFRNPSFLYSYMDDTNSYAMQEVASQTKGTAFQNYPVTFHFTGNREINPSKITSYDFSYRRGFRKLIANASVFYNTYKDRIEFRNIITDTYYEEVYAAAFAGAFAGMGCPAGNVPCATYMATTYGRPMPQNVEGTPINIGNAYSYGGELALDVMLSNSFTGTLGYALNRNVNKDDNPYTSANEKGRNKSMPLHKLNAGIRYKAKNGFSASLSGRYVDKTTRIIEFISGDVPAYTAVDAAIRVPVLDGHAELSLAGTNIFNEKHTEYVSGTGIAVFEADKIGRAITAGLTYKF